MPTVREKLTLLRGCTLSREIDWVTRVRCWSLILTEALTLVDCDCALLFVEGACAALLEGDCAVLLVVVGCAAALAPPLVGACIWPPAVAGGVLVCACGGCDVEDPAADDGAVVCACEELVDVLGEVDVDRSLVVSGAF